ncbi:HIT domain-containing protein [Paracoccus sp. S-4012]|uniref:HIT family protein n=1 Tax=Paracoccus sp. S-4012 TaxID=2665648 RepID=UPI0012AEFA59|nr:HIT domain-containing protein [Paracoccus sp. S-4012]MRX49564.1 HIT domain-containing protein [Paracoccus sp. S-4012]
MTDTCLFCRIARGELPAHRVYEDDRIMAFLDLHPIRPGHTLVIPKAHHVWFEDLPEDLATAVTTCAQALARRMKALYGVERVAMVYTGIHVPHAHAHVVPMQHVHDISSQAYLQAGTEGWSAPPQLPPAEGAGIARDLAAAFSGPAAAETAG